MTRLRPSRRARRILTRVLAPAAALGLLGGAATLTPALVLINESSSLPRGLYVRDLAARPDRGAVVALPQPKAVRPYLSRLGVPGEVRLIKRVAAVAGDPVCARADRIRVGARDLPVLAADRRGRPLPRWRGCRRLRPGERFLLGDTAESFDSRYFGPARAAALDGVYRPVLTW